MNYAAIVTFDKDSNKRLTDIWDRMSGCGLKAELLGTDVQPHITLAVADGIVEPDVFSALESFAASHRAFDVTLSHIGLFTTYMNVVYFGATMTSVFSGLHKSFYDSTKDCWSGLLDLYMPDMIVPHVTLCLNTDDDLISKAIEIARKERLPMTCRVEKLVLIDVKQLKEIRSWRLA